MAGNFRDAVIEWPTGQSISLLELMKQILGITDNSRDDELGMYLQVAGEACEKYIDNKIAEQPVKEDWSHARNQVALRYYPVQSIDSVIVDGVDELTDYELFRDVGLAWVVGDKCTLRIDDCFNQLAVGYTAGYAVLPGDLGYAVVITSLAYETERGAVSGSVKKESIVGVGSIEYTTSADSVSGVGLIPPSAISTLDLYRRYHV
jgi:hypothetical protein